MQRSLRKARKFDDFRGRTRRKFLALGVAGLSASVAGFFLGRETAPPPATESSVPASLLRRAQRLATAPSEELLADYATVLLVFERTVHDPALIAAYARLVDLATQRQDRALARHLLESSPRLPATLSPFRATLDSLAQGR
jgi:hypothetical protein